MDRHQRDTLLAQVQEGYNLPALSPVVVQLMERASDDAVTVGDLAGLISMDPALSVRLIRLANAAFLRRGEPAATIENAIQRLGLSRLRMMALSSSLRDVFPLAKSGALDYEEFWKTSLYRAIVAKEIAAETSAASPEEAFVAGLSLEVGLLVLHELLLKDRIETMPPLFPMDGLLEWETARFGLTHRDLGREALRCWNFPERIVACQQSGQDPTGAEPLPALVRLTEAASSFSSLIIDGISDWHTMFARVEQRFAIRSTALTSILAAAFEEVQETAEGLMIEVRRERDLERLLGKAKIALRELREAAETCSFVGAENASPGGTKKKKSPPHRMSAGMEAVAAELRTVLSTVSAFTHKITRAVAEGSPEWMTLQSFIWEIRKAEHALTLLS